MNVTILLSLLTAVIDHASEISALIQKLQAEGRDDLTGGEWQNILNSDDRARSVLSAAVAGSPEPTPIAAESQEKPVTPSDSSDNDIGH